MKPFQKVHLAAAIGIFVLLSSSNLSYAGGYLAVDTSGNPYKWNGPIVVHLDKGPLGKLTKSQADDLALDAMAHWTSAYIPGSTVQFVHGTDLVEDHGDGLGTDPNDDITTNLPPDGITAVIYDQTGLLLERAFGAQQAAAIVGAAGPIIPDDFSPSAITEGGAILNGKKYDDAPDEIFPDDIPYDQFKGAFIHEIGHMLNLDHAQAALAYSETGIEAGSIGGAYTPRFEPDYRGVPTMFPFVMPMMDGLEIDDKSWLLDLYGDAATKAGTGSISGTSYNFDGTTTNGINIVAYNADDPTSMITCVTGYTDPYGTTAGTGTYKIPTLPPGSNWVLDAEPVLGVFTGGSSVGPVDPPAVMAGAPEFLNEPAFESQSDPSYVSTTFGISADTSARHVTSANIRLNDINDVIHISEVDAGANENTGQFISAQPGKFLYISGVANPSESGPSSLIYGNFVDWYRVKPPAGLQLEQVFIISPDPDPVDVYLFDKTLSGELSFINGTLTGFGVNSNEYMIDSSRISEGPYAGTYYFGVGFPITFLGGSSNPGITDYTLGLLFSVSDRDPVVVKGIQSGVLNPAASTIRVQGRGFKNVGGIPPSVVVSTPSITVNSVTFVDSNNLDVSVTTSPSTPAGSSFTLQVNNAAQSGGFGGRRQLRVAGTPTQISDWEIYE